jgi:tetratricopeptide (TPR) repeat protein
MSLLLDALKQAEKQKNAENNTDVEQQEYATDSVELPINDPLVPEEVEEPVIDIDIKKQSAVHENEIQFEKVESEDIKPHSPVTNEPISPFVTEVKSTQETPTDDATLDASLNVFAVGNTQPKGGSFKKTSAISAVAIAILMLMGGALFYLENESTSKVSEQVLEDAPLFEEPEQQQLQNIEEVVVSQAPTQAAANIISNIKNTDVKLQADAQDKSPSVFIETGIKIKKRVISTGVYSQLDSAYQALKIGNLGLAKSIYSKVLKSRPNQVDALLGLANIESNEGSMQIARSLYEKVLIQEQTNPIAQLGLLQTYSDKAPLAKQHVLEELSSKYPNNVNILMALGQSYSEQSKWIKAQETYFKGFSLQPTNVSFAYNLAISLDQLGKVSAAITYYKKTISLNNKALNPIDMSVITRRLQDFGEAK